MKRFLVDLRRTHERAVLPSCAHAGDVGYDLCSIQHGRIDPGETVAVDTGWEIVGTCMRVLSRRVDDWVIDPAGIEFFMKVEARSSLALKSIFPVGGIIDPNYRGALKVLLYNGRHDKPYDVCVGDKIAQLVLYRVSLSTHAADFGPETPFVETKDGPSTTDRGSAGFGSTGR